MDDLRRLYEHQTMMAIGIYSFLDNLLMQIPSSSSNASGTDNNSEYSANSRRLPPLSRATELTESLRELNRGETFRDRHERIRLLSRLSNQPAVGSSRNRVDPSVNDTQNAASDTDTSNEVATPPKCDVAPGGYPEELFIYLSEREKEEYTCAVCYCVLKEAYQCRNEHRFCYGCIYTWSTGNTVGHDGCPVCRCDGLYAKNFDLIEKIDRKRARCIESGCNWMGFLGDYLNHEHRKYSPRELDSLICAKQLSSETRSQGETVSGIVTNEGREEFEMTENLTSGDFNDAQAICQVANASDSMTVSVEHPEIHRSEIVTQLNVIDLRRRTAVPRMPRLHSPSHQINQRRSATNLIVPQESRTRWYSRISSRQASNELNVTRSPVSLRTNRNSPMRFEAQTNETHRVGRVRTRSRQRSRSRQSVPPITPEPAMSTTPGSDTQVENRPGATMEQPGDGRLLPLRRVNVSGMETSPVSSPNSVPQLMRQQNTTSLGDVFERVTPEGAPRAPNSGNDQRQQDITDVRINPSFSLPHISRNMPLIVGRTSGPVYQNARELSSARDEDAQARIETTTVIQNNRPLEFRRLVPRRARRVTEQLRETREQLAAMLQMMTLELEERRQQVLNAAMETASRRRLLSNWMTRLSPESAHESEQEASPTDSVRNSSPDPGTQNNNVQNSLDVLRGLRTPQRSPSRHYLLRRLTNRLVTGRLHGHQPIACSPSFSTERYRTSSEERRPSTASSGESTSDEQPNAFWIPHMSRGHLRSNARSTAPIVLVTGRRTLAQLLTELRYPQTRINQWSSDEDDAGDTEED